MQLTPEQHNRVKKLASVIDKGSVGIAEILFGIEDKLGELKLDIETSKCEMHDKIDSMEMPDHKEDLDEIKGKLETEDEIIVTLNII